MLATLVALSPGDIGCVGHGPPKSCALFFFFYIFGEQRGHRHPRFAHERDPVDRRVSRLEAAFLFVWHSFGLASVARAAGDELEERFAGLGHKGDYPVTTAICPVVCLVQYEYCSGDVPFFCGTPPALQTVTMCRGNVAARCSRRRG